MYQSGTESDSIPALAAEFCGCASPAPTCQASAAVTVHDHFERFTAAAGEIFFDTTVAFTYTGGTVLLAEDEDGGGDAFVDDEIIVTVTHPDQTTATFDHDYSSGCAGVITHTNSDVTALFQPGVNQVRVQFRNTCGGNASADSLFLAPCD